MCGLIARHLARRRNLAGAEEAFIYGLFRNLGENLVIYYFPEEHGEIRRLMVTRGLSKLAASRGVLGVSYEDLGAAVARVWKLPDTIIDVIRGLPNDDPETPASEAERLRDIAIFAEELCDVAGMDDHAAQDEELARLVERFEPSVDVTAGFAGRLVAAGADKLRQYAPVFEIDVAGSSFCRSAIEWSLRYCEDGGAAVGETAGETDVQRQAG
jgi:HD-like signal output (HDOD) protein